MKLHPFTIVSLWDMIERNLAAFTVSNINADAFWRMMLAGQNGSSVTLSKDNIVPLGAALAFLRAFAKEASMPVTEQTCDEIFEELGKLQGVSGHIPSGGLDGLERKLSELCSGSIKEFQSKKMFVIKQAYSDFYVGGSSPSHFGIDTLQSFPSLKEEVADASNCMALGRWTASVMHLMRAMEVPLHALSRQLDHQPESKPNWGDILKAVEDKLRTKNRGNTPEPDDLRFYREVHGELGTFKDAFRNHAMHKHTRYDEERAIAIWHGTREFCRRLSSRLTEIEE